MNISLGRSSTLLLLVFCWNRPQSLSRLLDSVKNADYYSDIVDVKFVVDGEPDPTVLELVSNFSWAHGTKTVHKNHVWVGLEKNMIRAWDGGDDYKHALFLEDDVELSPQFYHYYKRLIQHHEHEFEANRLAGLSLYTPRKNEMSRINMIQLLNTIRSSDHFLLGIPCSWGGIYFNHHWKQFLEYYHENRSNPLKRLRASFSNKWNRSWKKYFIEYMYHNELYFLYPNLCDQYSFSTNHHELGVHCSKKPNNELYKVPLLRRDIVGFPLEPLEQLPIVNTLHELIYSADSSTIDGNCKD
eukprot:GHVN01097868.1.p1 GENE.GHVN01097868.1~~GHVN01097868.1.p1  ORF type:complete len:299 (+),score=7.63 GHVN01097868.1:188-1084(+)